MKSTRTAPEQQMVAFRADADIMKIIDENRGDLSRSQFIRRAIRTRMQSLQDPGEVSQ